MKTSNKLLLGLLILILIVITAGVVTIKLFSESKSVNLSGVVITQEKEISEFTGLSLSGRIKVFYTHNEQANLTLTGDSALLNHVEIFLNDNELSIKLNKKVADKNRVEVYLQNPGMNKLDVVAGAIFETTTAINMAALEANASAGGIATVEGEFTEFKGSASAGGIITVKGYVQHSTFNGSAGAQIQATECIVQYCEVNVSAGAFAKINVEKELNASASAGGTIMYLGSPNIIGTDITSGGSLTKMEQ